jgi:UDP-N-acetylmuramoyl-tripeptide--D-alanyl-D-alanine ligase
MAITVSRFADIVHGEAYGFAPGAHIAGFATDARDVGVGDLFLAIKGARVDGHDFVADAVSFGAVGALVERPVQGPHVLVPNLVEALAAFAAYFRSNYWSHVIGVTGSAGKTTAKEFIAAALSPAGRVLKTEGNRNTEYTVPLIWSGLEAGPYHFVVVEMSMRGLGQIRHLASFTKPTIGLITNVGFSHMSEVGSRDGIAQAKAELLESLPATGTAVLWADDPYLGYLKSKAPCRVVTFGLDSSAKGSFTTEILESVDVADTAPGGTARHPIVGACLITHYEATGWTSSRIRGFCFSEEFEADLPAVGRHIALGAAAAIAVAGIAGVAPAQAAKALRTAQLPPMRMEVVDLNGATVLLDTYNAAPPSMLAAIETFTELPCTGRRFAVIGEMRELGPYTEAAHRELGQVLASSGIDEVIFFGGPTALSLEEARMRGMVVHQAESLEDVAAFLRRAQPGDGVLVKGSRSLELELAVEGARAAGAGC